MLRIYAIIVLSVSIFQIFTTNAYAQSCEAFDRPGSQSGVALQSVLPASTLDRPTAMVQPQNDPSRWIIIDQEGTVSIFNHGSTFTRTGTLIDIRDRVTRTLEGRIWNELGLLSIAVHPDFDTNGYIFLCYTTDGPNSSSPILARPFHDFEKRTTARR